MTKAPILLITILLVLSIPAVSQQVIITGRIINATPSSSKVVKANFFNPVKHNGISAMADGHGRFGFKEDMLFTQDMTVNYGNNYFVYLYVSPGDSVNIVIDASLADNDKPGWGTISGSHALMSTQLNKCIQYMYSLPEHNYNYNVPPHAMLDSVKKDYARYLQLLQQYAYKYKLLPQVTQFIKTDIKYVISNNIADYAAMGDDSTQRQAHLQLFASPFFNMYGNGSFTSQMFPYHLSNYMYYLTRQDSSVNTAILQNNFTYALNRGAALLMHQPAGNARDYMLFRYLMFFVTKSPRILDSVQEVRPLFTHRVFYNQLLYNAAAIAHPLFTPAVVPNVVRLYANGDSALLPPGDIINYLVKENPGKVIYIDVYATWCAPCLAEFKNVPAIHEALKDKDVVFAYLCLNSTSHAVWKKIIAANHLAGSNFYLDPDATKLFMGNYVLDGYPSYILVNKRGGIVTTNAPRPSAKTQLVNVINHLQEE